MLGEAESENDNIPKLKREIGRTDDERYLGKLCDKTFLSLWSYPSVYNDDGLAKRGIGKEVCDLLVVFGKHIIIFSDKNCNFPDTGNLTLDWSRWFKKAIRKSADQAWGAERWIKHFPNRLFIDSRCTQPFPYSLPSSDEAEYHLIVVAHSCTDRCVQEFGGSGSLRIDSTIEGRSHYDRSKYEIKPFTIGDIDPNRSFIHVMDDVTLDIILNNNDTIHDFLSYLTRKEKLIRSKSTVKSFGEEDMLAFYLTHIDNEGIHDFVIPNDGSNVTIEKGLWRKFEMGDSYAAKQAADEVSYYWDYIIDRFAKHFIQGTSHFYTHTDVKDIELVLRGMAGESRLTRRMLSSAFIDMVRSPYENKPRLRYIPSKYLPPQYQEERPMYVFCACPHFDFLKDREEYRQFRYKYMQGAVMATKHAFPEATIIIGLATEAGLDLDARSEDAFYLDSRNWTGEDQERAAQLREELSIMQEPKILRMGFDEYPVSSTADVRSFSDMKPNDYPRNAQCPCGSGKKWKNCHGRSN